MDHIKFLPSVDGLNHDCFENIQVIPGVGEHLAVAKKYLKSYLRRNIPCLFVVVAVVHTEVGIIVYLEPSKQELVGSQIKLANNLWARDN